MTNLEFIEELKNIANKYKTLYVMGCFGAPMTEANKKRYTTNHSYNKQASRVKMINAATSDTFGFDCVNLIKGVLWGWKGDKTKTYGGASYASNGVPDIGADTMITKCLNISTTDWDKLVPGEAVWLEGHIGVYVGDNLVVESSPAFKNKVQFTGLANNGGKAGYNNRKWTKHGKLPYITYIEEDELDMTINEVAEKIDIDKLISRMSDEQILNLLTKIVSKMSGEQALQLLNKARIVLQQIQIADNDYGKPGLDWGVQEGLMIGNEKGNLMPEDLITRKQFMTVLKRYDEAR